MKKQAAGPLTCRLSWEKRSLLAVLLLILALLLLLVVLLILLAFVLVLIVPVLH